MLDDRKQTETIANIGEASTHQLAELAEAVLAQWGRYGREVSEALMARLEPGPRDPFVDEGLAQIISVEGVLDGRLESI